MKNLLIILLLALPVGWWVKDPLRAKGFVSKAVQWVESTVSGVSAHQGDQANSSDQGRLPKRVELPEGVYVLRESVTAKFLPVPGPIIKGTKVKIIGEGEGKKLVTDGTKQVLVEERLLTRDPSEVSVLMQAALEGLAADNARRRAELESNLSQIDNKIVSVNNELAAIKKRDAIARSQGKKGTQYGTQEDFLLAEIRRQEGFREAVLKQLSSIPQQ